MKNKNNISFIIENIKQDLISSGKTKAYRKISHANEKLRLLIYVEKSSSEWSLALGVFINNENLILPVMPRIKGINFKTIEQYNLKGTLVELNRNFDENIFINLIHDIMQRLNNLDTQRRISQIFMQTLELWKLFFSNNKLPLSEEGQIGLIGELFVLDELISNLKGSKDDFLKAWKGPLRGKHDFSLSKGSIEVKTSIGDFDRKFNIHGEDQLEIEKGKQLYLINPVMEIDENGKNINFYVNKIKTKLGHSNSTIVKFDHLLASYGYHFFHHEYYENEGVKLIYHKDYTYLVDEKFPKIIPQQFMPSIKIKDYVVFSESCINSIISRDTSFMGGSV